MKQLICHSRDCKTSLLQILATTSAIFGILANSNAEGTKASGSIGFPSYRGDGSGAAPESGLELVRSWSDAHLAWSSEEPAPPMGRGPNQLRDSNGVGGFGVPVVAGDFVYVGYLLPTGPKTDGCMAGPGQPMADEVVICMDAKTGKTVWRTVFAGKGWNYCAVYPSDGQITPCIADGKVLMQGSTGWAYCLDAHDGKVLWQKPTGKACLAWDGFKAAVLAGTEKPKRMSYADLKFAQERLAPPPPANPKHGGSGGGGFNSTPMLFGRVAVFNAAGTVAFDVTSGAVLWQRGAILQGSASVQKWIHDGKEYLIGAGVCVDPATGKDLWSFGPVGGAYQGYTAAISGDLWVGVRNDSNTKPARGEGKTWVECLRFSPTGATSVWRLPADSGFCYMSPVIHRGRLYATMGLPKWNTPEEMEAMTGIKDYAGPSASGDTCIDMATGKVLGTTGNSGNDQGNSPFAMDGRIFTHGSQMFDAQPEPKGIWKPLATLKPRTVNCTFPTGANGFLYLRAAGSKSLVECWDLRVRE